MLSTVPLEDPLAGSGALPRGAGQDLADPDAKGALDAPVIAPTLFSKRVSELDKLSDERA